MNDQAVYPTTFTSSILIAGTKTGSLNKVFDRVACKVLTNATPKSLEQYQKFLFYIKDP